MRIREFFETVISVNQPIFAGSVGIVAPGFDKSMQEARIRQLLQGFNVSFENVDLEPLLSNCPELKSGPIEAIWRVHISRKELYMKFTALGFNPPGGVAAQKTLLQFQNIFIDVVDDITNVEGNSLVLLHGRPK